MCSLESEECIVHIDQDVDSVSNLDGRNVAMNQRASVVHLVDCWHGCLFGAAHSFHKIAIEDLKCDAYWWVAVDFLWREAGASEKIPVQPADHKPSHRFMPRVESELHW